MGEEPTCSFVRTQFSKPTLPKISSTDKMGKRGQKRKSERQTKASFAIVVFPSAAVVACFLLPSSPFAKTYVHKYYVVSAQSPQTKRSVSFLLPSPISPPIYTKLSPSLSSLPLEEEKNRPPPSVRLHCVRTVRADKNTFAAGASCWGDTCRKIEPRIEDRPWGSYPRCYSCSWGPPAPWQPTAGD